MCDRSPITKPSAIPTINPVRLPVAMPIAKIKQASYAVYGVRPAEINVITLRMKLPRTPSTNPVPQPASAQAANTLLGQRLGHRLRSLPPMVIGGTHHLSLHLMYPLNTPTAGNIMQIASRWVVPCTTQWVKSTAARLAPGAQAGRSPYDPALTAYTVRSQLPM